MPLNAADIPTPGPMGGWRDLRREIDGLRRDLALVRATALTGQDIPAPYVPPVVPHGHRVRRRTSALAIPNNAWTLVQWDTTAETSGGNAAVAVPNTADIQATIPGLFFYSSQIHFVEGGADALREMRMMHNGASVDLVSTRTAGAVTLQLTRPILMAAGDILGVEAYQASGGNLNIWGAGTHNYHSLYLIRAA